MFEVAERKPNSLWIFLLSSATVPPIVGLISDLVFVPSAALLGIPASAGLTGGSGLATIRPTHWSDVAVTAVTLTGTAFGLGSIVGRRWPWLIRAGRWIWALPLILFLSEFSRIASHASLNETFGMFFQGTLGADEGLQYLVCTIPALSTIGYALGLQVHVEKSRNSTARS
jgi:hypothetical protein